MHTLIQPHRNYTWSLNSMALSISKNGLKSLFILAMALLASCASAPSINVKSAKEKKPSDTILDSIISRSIKASAQVSIYTAEIIASEAAEKELKKFRSGEHDGTPVIFAEDSVETKELFEGKYYQELTEHLVEELAKWYQGKIPESGGLFLQSNSFRVFSPNDALTEFTDGIDLADIIGSFTYYIRVTTKDGMIYFTGVNKLSLESYAGENYLGHGLAENPNLGPLSSTTQVFKWRVIIPEKYRQ